MLLRIAEGLGIVFGAEKRFYWLMSEAAVPREASDDQGF